MIKANHHILYERFFGLYLDRAMRKDFQAHRIIELPGDGREPVRPEQQHFISVSTAFYRFLHGHSVLMIGNHFSWWDGFIARRVNRLVLKRRLHVMMLEEQLRPRMFLSRLGAFSIRPKHRSALESINYSLERLQDPQNLVVMFPQGRFQSSYQVPVTFENGWFRILQKATEQTRLVFMANLTDYFEHRKPLLNTYLRAVDVTFADGKSVEDAYNSFLKEAVGAQDAFTGGA